MCIRDRVKTQTISGLSAKTIGFFATEGVTAVSYTHLAGINVILPGVRW